MVYLPLLILFNTNLAAGPAQTFLFFYQAVSVAMPIDIFVNEHLIGGGLWWGLFTMQSPINEFIGSHLLPADYRLFPRILPYIALQYFKLAAVFVITFTTLPYQWLYPLISFQRLTQLQEGSGGDFSQCRAQ